jgi:TonB-linked SusC/RagA family outer membrane protein
MAIVAGAAPLAAQGVVAGVVTSEAQGTPVPGAQVMVAGTGLGAQTAEDGTFRITGVSGTEVTLEVRRIGFRATRQTVRVGATNLQIEMPVSLVNLSEIVVTGTPGATQRRAIGNAVTTINASEVTDRAPINSIQDLLNGRAAGVVVMPATGMVGTGSRIRVRGTSSFSLSNQPLIYVDGVRINSQTGSGPANQAFGSSSISRFNDINPEDIESIEVLKGPAASTLYGTEASNGVIQIITKRGASGSSGEPRWNLSLKQGANYLADVEGIFETNWQVVGTDTQSIDIVELEKAAGRDIWRTGNLQEYDVSVSGGTSLFNYFLAGGYEMSEGADPGNDLERYNTRANFSVRPTEQLAADVSLGYISGLTNLGCEAGCGGRVWGVVLANPQNLVGANANRRGFHSGTPEQYDLLSNFWQDIDRFTASLQLRHSPISWLSHRLNIGVDRTREEDVSFTPRVDSMVAYSAWGQVLGGRSQTERTINMSTVDYAATLSFAPIPDVTSQTAFGGQYYSSGTGFIHASGSVFPFPGLTSVAATTTSRVNDQDFVEEKSLGFFVQQQFGWRDRLFLTAGVRSDDHSAFGQNFDRVNYPKVSGSWVISEEPFWTVPFVDALKLRVAYGETGQQPPTFAAVRTYEPVTGPNDAPAVTPQIIGNPDLGPERGREIEIGFDAGFLDDRLGLELTYYNQRTEDAILSRSIAPSIGFSGSQFFNAGEIRNTGLEMLARARAWDRDPVMVDLTLNIATNDNEVISLGETDLDFFSPSQYVRHQVGYPVGSWFEQRIVSATFNPTTRLAENVMCDDGAGGSMPCAGADGTRGNADDAPDVFLGRSTPDFEGSFTSTVTIWNRLRVYAMLDFKRGNTKLDGNTRVRCYFFGGRCRENFFPEEFAPERVASIQSNSNYINLLFADASFTKLRELSIAYDLPAQWASAMRSNRASVSLAGRNLYTWTPFPGLEPEAMFLGGSRAGHAVWEQTTLPQLAQWVFTVNLGF